LLHSSGRPWLFGCWAADELVAAQGGGIRVAVIARCPVTAAALSALADRVRTVADLDRLGPGCRAVFIWWLSLWPLSWNACTPPDW
jgi:asparagine synthase (glutamine-hydrolysing)